MTLLLGLGAGLCWGVADFFGGLQSRRIPALAVALWSQLAGAVVLLLVLRVLGEGPSTGGLLWGMAAGVFGGVALVLFYRGLSTGMMSVVAPISATGAVIPVVAGLLLGEIPDPLAMVGVVLAICGIVLVSLQHGAGDVAAAPRSALLLALGAAVGFGMFFVLVDRASAVGSSPLWSIAGARAGSLLTLAAIVALGRSGAPLPARGAVPVAIVGTLDTTANGLYAYAATTGDLGVAAVLASLYPVATVLLGRVVLGERLSPVQLSGVAVALLGIGLLSAG